jgi:deoxyadenosine/deoxycytidine kinase
MKGKVIAISGVIGVGKTTLATDLGKLARMPVFYEEVVENGYLEDFYRDMKKYSFPLQIYLLNKRFRQQQQVLWSESGGIIDRSIYEDLVFAKMLCEEGHMRYSKT